MGDHVRLLAHFVGPRLPLLKAVERVEVDRLAVPVAREWCTLLDLRLTGMRDQYVLGTDSKCAGHIDAESMILPEPRLRLDSYEGRDPGSLARPNQVFDAAPVVAGEHLIDDEPVKTDVS